MVALSGCSFGQSPAPEPSGTFDNTATPPGTVTESATPSTAPTERTTPTPAPDPTTTKPGPSTSPAKLDAVASLSRASIDPSTGDLLLGGFVVGVFEDGGTCIFTASPSSGAVPLVVTTTGVANVDSTSCGSTSLPKDRIQAGTYTVVLTYQNGNGATTSAPMTVKVTS